MLEEELEELEFDELDSLPAPCPPHAVNAKASNPTKLILFICKTCIFPVVVSGHLRLAFNKTRGWPTPARASRKHPGVDKVNYAVTLNCKTVKQKPNDF